MQKSFLKKSDLCCPSGVEVREFLSEFFPVVFMVKIAVENGPLPLPHFVFQLRSNVNILRKIISK